jgi:hypothetical protein
VDRIKKEMEIMPPAPTQVRDINITDSGEEENNG